MLEVQSIVVTNTTLTTLPVNVRGTENGQSCLWRMNSKYIFKGVRGLGPYGPRALAGGGHPADIPSRIL